jgi:hypothetical protein
MTKTFLVQLILITIRTSLLFIVETFLQIMYYTIATKYFTSFMSIYNFSDIFNDSLKTVGYIKLIYFFPIYLGFYVIATYKSLGFVATHKSNSVVESRNHAILFLVVYLVIGSLNPIFFFQNLYDVILLTSIAFVSFFITKKIFQLSKF